VTARPRIAPLISAEEIRARVGELAERIARDYGDARLTLVCIAEGARRFTDDLLVRLAARGLRPERIDVRARRSAGTSLGPVAIDPFEPERLEGRDVLVLDDIADEGATLRAVLEIAALGEPRSLRTAVLVDKRERRREAVPLDYVGFPVERGWVVGYGMDLDGRYRELDWIGVLVDERF
jgi:hypoxanthine phosphoribosyltransferase